MYLLLFASEINCMTNSIGEMHSIFHTLKEMKTLYALFSERRLYSPIIVFFKIRRRSLLSIVSKNSSDTRVAVVTLNVMLFLYFRHIEKIIDDTMVSRS